MLIYLTKQEAAAAAQHLRGHECNMPSTQLQPSFSANSIYQDLSYLGRHIQVQFSPIRSSMLGFFIDASGNIYPHCLHSTREWKRVTGDLSLTVSAYKIPTILALIFLSFVSLLLASVSWNNSSYVWGLVPVHPAHPPQHQTRMPVVVYICLILAIPRSIKSTIDWSQPEFD